MSTARLLSARSQHRVAVENEMIKRREKEFKHQQTWNGQVNYYKHWEKANNKFEEWTSPRYFECNNQMIDGMKKEREKNEDLYKRREKLRKLYEEEEKSYQIEMMVKNRYKLLKTRRSTKLDEIPTELLKDVNLGLKIEEDDRRRHEAELGLYHRWRLNNPIVRRHEINKRTKDLKLSWLDQQIEKRMEKEKREEECKKMLEERKKRLEEERLKHQQIERQRAEKNKQLQEEIAKQAEYLVVKQNESKELRKQEDDEMSIRLKLYELEETQRNEERRRAERECALYNVKQHRMKLKQKAQIVQENLEQEKQLLQRLIDSKIAEQIEDANKKDEVKRTLDEFLQCTREQQALERRRQKHFDFVFDSESRYVYERQNEIWQSEQNARRNLIDEVLKSVREQIDEKIEKNKEKQKKIIEERESTVKIIEEYNQEIENLQAENERKKHERRKAIDAQVKEKFSRKLSEESQQQKRIEDELEKIRKEEERLKREILNLQKRQGPYRPARSKIFF